MYLFANTCVSHIRKGFKHFSAAESAEDAKEQAKKLLMSGVG